MNQYLGKQVNVKIDRPLGSKHPKHDLIYPINYGYIPNTISGDGEEIDAYVIGAFEPLESFEGYVVAVIHRFNDNEDKLVVAREKELYTVDYIKALTEFQERFFQSEIITIQFPYYNDENKTYLNFEEEKHTFFNLLEKDRKMILATSYDNKVTARTMSCIIMNEKIYFQTDKAFEKYHQLINNPNVALCINNIQIEGVARVKGHPLSTKNKRFADIFKVLEYNAYHKYSHLKNEVVIEVEIKQATIWKYKMGKAFREYIDFQNRKAFRSYYEHGK